MALITWEADLDCGTKSIDDQHRELVNMVNELHDGMKSGQGSAILGDILVRLASYTVSHFAHEEDIMAKRAMPGVTAHKLEHAKLLASVSSFVSAFKAGKAPLTMEIINFLRKWLIDHIRGMDLKTFKNAARAAA